MPTLEQLLPLLEADPGDAFARYAVAMEYAKQARYAEALGQFAELLRRHPDYVPGYFMAGRTAKQNGDAAEAKRWYTQGIAAAQRTGDRHAADEISEALLMLE
jgi:tetratricopeptide (TPR) repeat protein